MPVLPTPETTLANPPSSKQLQLGFMSLQVGELFPYVYIVQAILHYFERFLSIILMGQGMWGKDLEPQ